MLPILLHSLQSPDGGSCRPAYAAAAETVSVTTPADVGDCLPRAHRHPFPGWTRSGGSAVIGCSTRLCQCLLMLNENLENSIQVVSISVQANKV